jgi:hypothetical protein
MLKLVRYRTKLTQSGIFLVQYRTKIWDAGMPMPALVSSMPMPSYEYKYCLSSTNLEGVLEPLLLPLPVRDHFLRAVGMKFRPCTTDGTVSVKFFHTDQSLENFDTQDIYTSKPVLGRV